jgi:hypothetical protein
MGSCDEVDDCEAEPRASVSSRGVCPAETVESAFAECRREARSAVANVELDEGAVRFCGEFQRAGAVGECVVDEIAERLFDAEWVDVEVGGRGIDAKLTAEGVGAGREAVGYGAQQGIRIDPFSPDRKGSLVGARDEEQFLGEPREALGFFGGRPQRGGKFVMGTWSAEREVELCAKKREGRPELMARVGDEAALVFDGRLKARQHVVQCDSQSGDLVTRVGQGEAGCLSGSDCLCTAPQSLDGAKSAGGERVAAERCREQREREKGDELVPEVVERLGARFERAGDDRDSVFRRVAHGENAPLAGLAGNVLVEEDALSTERAGKSGAPEKGRRLAGLGLQDVSVGCEDLGERCAAAGVGVGAFVREFVFRLGGERLVDGREKLVSDALVDEETDAGEYDSHREGETEREANANREAAHGSARRR